MTLLSSYRNKKLIFIDVPEVYKKASAENENDHW
jgi:hypothetical protein